MDISLTSLHLLTDDDLSELRDGLEIFRDGFAPGKRARPRLSRLYGTLADTVTAEIVSRWSGGSATAVPVVVELEAASELSSVELQALMRECFRRRQLLDEKPAVSGFWTDVLLCLMDAREADGQAARILEDLD